MKQETMQRGFRRQPIWLSLLISILVATGGQGLSAQKSAQDYLVFVVCESADTLTLLRFGPGGLHVEKQAKVGMMPMDINGPHGIAVSPDKKYVYVAVGHGRPYGSAWKFDAATLAPMQYTNLGLFPATSDISKDGSFLYIANANFHGDMKPSSVSAVATGEMIEVKRIPTCTMPHGSRLNPQGTKQYSACMMDDMLVEIDTHTLKVARHFVVTKGREMGIAGPPRVGNTMAAKSNAKPATGTTGMKGMHNMDGMSAMKDSGGHGMEPPKPGDISCSPTWAQPSADGSSIFVACNKSSEIVEVNANTWKLT